MSVAARAGRLRLIGYTRKHGPALLRGSNPCTRRRLMRRLRPGALAPAVKSRSLRSFTRRCSEKQRSVAYTS